MSEVAAVSEDELVVSVLGIYDAGNTALIENVTVFGGGGAGGFLDTVQGSIVNGVSEKSGAGAGILLQDTNHCVVENSAADANGGKGIGSAIGILVQDSGSTKLSKSNFIVNNQPSGNALWGIYVSSEENIIANNTADGNNADNEGGWGIYLDSSAAHNFLSDNTASGNEEYDGDDETPHCGTNHWSSNALTKVNQKCVPLIQNDLSAGRPRP